MSLLPAKRIVLEELFLRDKQLKPAQIAEETGNKLNSTMMHLIWLVRAGYVVAPEKGQYMITEEGRKVLGIPEVTREMATSILAQSQKDKAFQFYAGLDAPLNLFADGIQDFLDKIPEVPMQSLEFHLNREDFEKWFDCLGDVELSKKTAVLRDRKISGEQLREMLREMVASRYAALSKLL